MSSSRHWLSEREPVWRRLEALLDRRDAPMGRVSSTETRELCLSYRGVAADLAHAQSTPACRYLLPYLNQLTRRLHGVTYETPPARWSSIRNFLVTSIPQCFRRNVAFIAAGFATFCLGAVIAGATTYFNPEAETFFLPAAVIEQVAQGKLWMAGVAAAPSKSSFLMTNNIRVAFQAYVGGLFLGVGSLLALFYNGIFAFGGPLAVCWRHGMAGPLLLFMLPHGVVELTTIFIAGGAGMMVGHAALFCGERPRNLHLYARVRESLVLVAACVGFLVIAGIIEGMISLNPAVPAWARLVISALSGVLMFAYLFLSGRRRPQE